MSVLKAVVAASVAAPLVLPAVLAAALWVVVLTRQAWARVVLMSVCTVEVALLIHRASQFHGGHGGHGSLASLLRAGASVVVLVTVSSDGARRRVAARAARQGR